MVRGGRQKVRRDAVFTWLVVGLVPAFLAILCLVIEGLSVLSEEEEQFSLTVGGVLVRDISTNAGKHLFPYFATVISLTVLVIGCLCLVQNGGELSKM